MAKIVRQCLAKTLSDPSTPLFPLLVSLGTRLLHEITEQLLELVMR